MATRASWSGYLKVSLLSVPIKAYSASTGDAGKITMRQLHSGCWQRIRHVTSCPAHGSVTREEISLGYEAADGEYVVVTDEELAALDETDERNVEIDAFVPASQIDPVYLTERTWYLTPGSPAGQRLYALLRDGLKDGSRHAVGRAIINRRVCPVLLRAVDRLIALSVLRYDSQITRPEAFDELVTESDSAFEEQMLIRQLMESLARTDFDLGIYRDQYAEKLSRLIESKSADRTSSPTTVSPSAATDDQLLELLKRTLQHVADGACDDIGTGIAS